MAQQNSPQTSEIKVGETVTGTVEQILPYGAFVRLASGQKAMVHISELAHSFVKKVEDVLQKDQEIKARIIKIDERGRIDLSIKQLQPRPQRPQRNAPGSGDDFEKKLASFMKASDQKFSDLNKKAKDSRGGKGRGK